MLCIWLHLRDDLKMQYSVDIMCDVIIIEITTVFLGMQYSVDIMCDVIIIEITTVFLGRP